MIVLLSFIRRLGKQTDKSYSTILDCVCETKERLDASASRREIEKNVSTGNRPMCFVYLINIRDDLSDSHSVKTMKTVGWNEVYIVGSGAVGCLLVCGRLCVPFSPSTKQPSGS